MAEIRQLMLAERLVTQPARALKNKIKIYISHGVVSLKVNLQ